MRLLLDQNVSPKLVETLSELFPESVHTQNVSLNSASDEEVWAFAKANNLIILTKDSDFAERSLLFGFPPKIIWIRKGNCSTKDIEKILKDNFEEIRMLSENKDIGIISLY